MEPTEPTSSGGAPEQPERPDPRRPLRRTGGRIGAIVTWATVVVAVALLGVNWAGRVLFAPPAALTAAVTFLPYLYGALVLWGFALWSAVPDRREPPVVITVLVVAAAVLWGPSWPARGEADSAGSPVTMMTWNLRRLWGGPDDGGDPLRCAVEAIRAADPDVLTLNEVSRDDLDALEQELGLTCVHSTYHRSDSTTKGGLAACTRGGRWSLQGGSPQRFVDDEDWYYVFTEVEHDGRVFNLLAVHLYPYAFSTQRLRTGVRELTRGQTEELAELSRDGHQVVKAQSDQSAALLERVERFRDPTIVAGDFNSTRDAALHASLRETLIDTWERGGTGFGGTVRFVDLAPLRIDYAYATRAFAVVGAEVPDVGCSDHRPVVSRLVLRSETVAAER